MKNTFVQWIKPSTFALFALLGFAACSEDHFDIKDTGVGEKTLWENIRANPELSDFAQILERTKVMKSENDKVSQLKASDLLNQMQSFTLWAPLNGTYNAQAWKDTLDKIDKLYAEGTSESTLTAQKLQYAVWQQFAANHIARFNYEGLGEQRIRLFNNKRVDYSGTSFNGVNLNGTVVSATNGTLHMLKGSSPFAYNIYDYLSATPELSTIMQDIRRPEYEKIDTLWDRSPKGALNEYGEMVYIDTLISRHNLLLSQSNALIRNEDSTYIALLPTNKAWKEALEKVGKVFTFGANYSYAWNGQEFQRNSKQGNHYALDRAMHSDPSRTLADSLKENIVQSSIIRNLFFAPYRIKGGESMNSTELINHVTHADSLISTGGLVFYNPAAQEAAPDATFNPNFSGLTPYRASNGYIYKLENYSFDPAYTFVSEVSFQPSQQPTYYVARTGNATSKNGITLRLNENNHNKRRKVMKDEDENSEAMESEEQYEGVEGKVLSDTYQRFVMDSPQSDLVVDFRLPDILSAAYRIKVIMVPSKINLDVVPEPEKDNEIVKFRAQIVDDEENASESVTIDQTKGQFDQNKVNEIVLWEKYTFPKAYKGLPNDYTSFPRLRLTLPRARRGKLDCKALNIVKVIVEPYRGQ